jgi:hypothetical protein
VRNRFRSLGFFTDAQQLGTGILHQKNEDNSGGVSARHACLSHQREHVGEGLSLVDENGSTLLMQILPCGDRTYSIPDVPWNKLHAPGPRCVWDNGRWAVTEFGLEPLYSKEPERYEAYVIPAAHLLDTRGFGAPLYFWPVQVAAQAWLDLDAFEEAFKKSLEIHSQKYQLDVDSYVLEKSFRRARGERRRFAPI